MPEKKKKEGRMEVRLCEPYEGKGKRGKKGPRFPG